MVFYLFFGVLIFDLILVKFCEWYNYVNLILLISEFYVIMVKDDVFLLIWVVSKINENFYVFIVLERGIGKIKII